MDCGRRVLCTREERAGTPPWQAPFHKGAGAYMHRLGGTCPCGQTHGQARLSMALEAEPHAAKKAVLVKATPRPLDVSAIDAVYRDYLDLLPLRSEHREYFRRRGRADEEVALAHHYGSLPFGYDAARAVIDSLVAKHGEDVIARTPGFYRSDRDGRLITHTARRNSDAAVMPAYDEQGRITGMVRAMTVGRVQAKYKTFVGGGGDFYTVVGQEWEPGQRRILYIVEGTHKARVVAHLFGVRVLGLPATNFRPAHAEAVRRLDPEFVVEALDADKLLKPAVARQQTTLLNRLLELGYEVLTAVWEPEDGKGLDDLLTNGYRPRLRTVERRPAVGPRKPRPTPHLMLVPSGRSLREVQDETSQIVTKFIRDRRGHCGRVFVVQAPPGVGKTSCAVQAAIEHGAPARIVVATKSKAQELAVRYPANVHAVEGRNQVNCAYFPVVEAARRQDHDVADVVCRRCPQRDLDCSLFKGRYYQQFQQDGILVGTTEMLYSGQFLRRGDLVIVDDADLARAMIDTRRISAKTLLNLAARIDAGPLRELLTLIQRAVDGTSALLIGPHAWDALARAAGGASRLVALINTLPDAEDFQPKPSDGRSLTVSDIENAPPAVLGVLVNLLREERDAFASGEDFNSGLALEHGCLELRMLRKLPVNYDTGASLLQSRAVLVLDAIPLMLLYRCLADGMELDPGHAPVVELPSTVTVIQFADRGFGKASVERSCTDRTGTQRQPGKESLLASLDAARRRYPGKLEAVICAKSLKPDVVTRGIPEERVLTYYGNRGLNAIENADVVHVLGRPQAPTTEVFQLTKVLDKGGAPIRPHLVLRSAGYAGYVGPDGQGREIDILDFEDERASAVMQAFREAELVQSIHRARLYRVAPELSALETDIETMKFYAGMRRRLRVVLHTQHPIPGLPVHELIYDPTPPEDHNATVAAEAAARILAARDQLLAEGIPPTDAAIAR